MSLHQDLQTHAVVAVNEYKPKLPFPTGHVNVSFFFRSIAQGTFGRNSAGVDSKGHIHTFDPLAGSGGVFIEATAGALTHYVIVSDQNYFDMRSFAQGQAKLTSTSKTTYGFIGNNCADFIWQVFQHSTLPPRYKDITIYLTNKWEPVAIYAEGDALNYEPKPIPISASTAKR